MLASSKAPSAFSSDFFLHNLRFFFHDHSAKLRFEGVEISDRARKVRRKDRHLGNKSWWNVWMLVNERIFSLTRPMRDRSIDGSKWRREKKKTPREYLFYVQTRKISGFSRSSINKTVSSICCGVFLLSYSFANGISDKTRVLQDSLLVWHNISLFLALALVLFSLVLATLDKMKTRQEQWTLQARPTLGCTCTRETSWENWEKQILRSCKSLER